LLGFKVFQQGLHDLFIEFFEELLGFRHINLDEFVKSEPVLLWLLNREVHDSQWIQVLLILFLDCVKESKLYVDFNNKIKRNSLWNILTFLQQGLLSRGLSRFDHLYQLLLCRESRVDFQTNDIKLRKEHKSVLKSVKHNINECNLIIFDG
jgi:hypothetical protein